MIHCRCYGKLNDFLPVSRRQRTVSVFSSHYSVIELLQFLEIPPKEVHLILVNGEAVNFSCSINENDRISLYPQFQSINLSTLH